MRASAVAGIVLGAVLATALLFVGSWYLLDHSGGYAGVLPAHFLQFLRDIRHDLGEGDKAPFGRFWEIISFISTSALFVCGIATLLVTRGQLVSAENVRLATVYIEISKRWESAELVQSRRNILTLKHEYETLSEAYRLNTSVQEHICNVLFGIKEYDGINHTTILRKHTIILNFLEDVGLMCRQSYLKADDIFDFIGSGMETYTTLLSVYIKRVRAAAPAQEAQETASFPSGKPREPVQDNGEDRRVYANVLWLTEQMRMRNSFEFPPRNSGPALARLAGWLRRTAKSGKP